MIIQIAIVFCGIFSIQSFANTTGPRTINHGGCVITLYPNGGIHIGTAKDTPTLSISPNLASGGANGSTNSVIINNTGKCTADKSSKQSIKTALLEKYKTAPLGEQDFIRKILPELEKSDLQQSASLPQSGGAAR